MLAALLTLAAAVVASVPLSRMLGRSAGWPLAGLYLVAAAFVAGPATTVLAGGTPERHVAWVPSLGVDLWLRADGLGLVFGGIALVVGAIVLSYSAVYLSKDAQHTTFYLAMAGFTLSMLVLVLADNLMVFFLCWELTSLASFLLIARSGRAGQAASMRTLLLTFVGGVALLVAVVIMSLRTGSLSLHAAVNSPVWHDGSALSALTAVLIAIAGFSKAAQFPFHVWLPDAMAAPTPASAYLHAAAVVKVGIFLLLRFSPAVHDNPVWNVLLIVTGLFTGLIGARFALVQTDLKRLMAYSTVSQLGLMTATIGVGTEAALAAATVHVIAHALFKSGLFMVVGVIDHATHTRDLRRLPVLWRRMPVMMGIAAMGAGAMAGLPPLLGFVSKEGLLAALSDTPGPPWADWSALAVATVISIMTFAYCVKIVLGGFVDGADSRQVVPTERPLDLIAGLPIVAGIPLGLAAGWLDAPVSMATRAALLHGADPHVHLSLWHGLTPELGATMVIIASGVAFAVTRRRWWPVLEQSVLPFDGPQVIAALRNTLRRAGTALAEPANVVAPTRHLVAILVTISVILGASTAALVVSGHLPPSRVAQVRPGEVAVLVLLVVAVVTVCRSVSRLGATVGLSTVGILMTVEIIALGAPDVALTQVLVESLTVIVIMLVSQRLPRSFRGTRLGPARRLVLAVALAAGVAATLGVWVLTGRRDRSAVGDYYLDHTYALTGGTNVVNVILVEFRALDTFGELTVLGMAGVAVIAIISSVRSENLDPAQVGRDPDAEAEPVLRPEGTAAHTAITSAWTNIIGPQLLVKVLTPVLLVASGWMFWRGHNDPGGGFIAALVTACAFALHYLTTVRDRQVGPKRAPLLLIGGGIIVAIVVGVWGLLAKGSFLQAVHADILGVHVSSSLLFDLGVYTAVLGLVMIAFNLLGAGETTGVEPGTEGTRERADQTVEGDLPGPLDTVRGDGGSRRPPRPGIGTDLISSGTTSTRSVPTHNEPDDSEPAHHTSGTWGEDT